LFSSITYHPALLFNGISELVQVSVEPIVQIHSFTAILNAASAAPRDVCDATVRAVLPFLEGLVSEPTFRAVSNDAIKDSFKLLSLGLLSLCSEESDYQARVLRLASTAFEFQPYLFTIALTDVLEEESHTALNGGVKFGKEILMPENPEDGLFLVCTALSSPRL
jgi:hypothetical protein